MTESQETQAQPALPTRVDLATSGLTKRNQEFIWQMVQLVDGDASKAGLIAEVGAKLLDGQKTGATAKQLFNTPAEALGFKAKQAAETPARGYATYGFWPLMVDNAIAFFMMFSFMFGLTLMFSKANQAGSAGAAGITSLVLTSLLGGVFFAAVTMTLAPSKDGVQTPLWKKIVVSVGAFVLWFLAYMGFAYLPSIINPLLPGWVYLILAVLAFIGFRFWRVKTGIQGGFLGSATRPRQDTK
ncbi:DUF1129 family protein [Weissella cibaria]|uniref:DUF1129 family protein n=1 Tax=Weissella cibaria TaxID=137591 RepID=UPI00168124B7|nr:DUF1129 family protein [Weissella cibaria]MBD1501437.1 DUF1129 family protein [Weissella cibaria]MCG4287218.1 DUF1129 domain-containing protein [Weissella cibaria]